MKIYTKTGDTGETSLLGGGRVPKHDHRVAAYGEVDELNSAIGVVLACEPHDFEVELLQAIQRDLFAIGGRLASPEPQKVDKALAKATLNPDRVAELERAIDAADHELPELTSFILPGGSPKAAALHLCRTVCRRAERSVDRLAEEQSVEPQILAYLNRLSDVLFTLARLANQRTGIPDQEW